MGAVVISLKYLVVPVEGVLSNTVGVGVPTCGALEGSTYVFG